MKHKIIAYLVLAAALSVCCPAHAELFQPKDRSAYLVKGSTQDPSGDKDNMLNKKPIEELNWLRNKAATEESKRRKLEISLQLTKAQLEKVQNENRHLTTEVAELKKSYQAMQYASAPTLNGTPKVAPYFLKQGYYEVVDGESLWKIAKRADVFDNPLKWIELYYANKDKIDDPDMIYPGQVLVIPDYYIVPDVTEPEQPQKKSTSEQQ